MRSILCTIPCFSSPIRCCRWGRAGSCAIWRLPQNASRWERYRIEGAGGGEHVPQGPIGAVFGGAKDRKVFAVTDDMVHVLDVESMTWIDSRDRAQVFPELGQATLRFAWSLNQGEALGDPPVTDETVALYSSDTLWSFVLNTNTLTSTFNTAGACCDDGPGEFAPIDSQVNATWYDPQNANEWFDVTLDLCDQPDDPLAGHTVYLVADNTVRPQAPAFCFEFLGSFSYPQQEPFSYPNAPPTVNSFADITIVRDLVAIGPNEP